MLALKSHDQAGKKKSASGAESSSTPQIKREHFFCLNDHEILKYKVRKKAFRQTLDSGVSTDI